MTTWLRAIRVHQWAKNGLLVVPALAAHLEPGPGLLLTLLLAFASFSLLASAVYLLNDLVDLEHDRAHPLKRNRPLAAGKITPGGALAVMAVFAAGSFLLSLTLPTGFLWAWVSYLVLTTAYSFFLKRIVMLDVVVLAALYTVRVVAGAAAVEVPLSRWFLAFSVFVFLSLAMVKRLVETRGLAGLPAESPSETSSETPVEGKTLAGRGWRSEDEPLLLGFGTAAAAASALVYCLYITGDEVVGLYGRPDLLWLGLPILLYWLARVWLLANRGELHDDPVVFALTDGASYAVGVGFLAMLLLAA